MRSRWRSFHFEIHIERNQLRSLPLRHCGPSTQGGAAVMKRTLLGLVVACLLAGLVTRAQPTPAFKLGTFARDGQTFVGVVLRDAVVIDFARAHAAVPAAA